MTARQFGPYAARIIGPQARITGPRGTSLIANASWLRSLVHTTEGDKAAAYAWAIEELEGRE